MYQQIELLKRAPGAKLQWKSFTKEWFTGLLLNQNAIDKITWHTASNQNSTETWL